jgi:3-dehydrosphinganine reductase
MSDFSGKTVFITGVGSGMGLESAKQLAAQGAHIVGFDRTGAAATREAIEAVRQRATQRVTLFVADVSDRARTLTAINEAVAACGKPDLLIHMAGIGGVAEMTAMAYDFFDRMMQINVYGTRHIVEAVLPHMLDRADGQRPKILLVASMGGFVPVYGYTAYGTSKFAVVGFAQCLRYELKPRGVDVVCFCPGEVQTPALAKEYEQTHPATRAMKAIGGQMSMVAAIEGLVSGLRGNRFLIVPGWRTRLVHLALRLTPSGLWNAITDAIVARALARSSH